MNIKVTVEEPEVLEVNQQFPMLAKWNGTGDASLIVLFNSEFRGIALKSDHKGFIGMEESWVGLHDTLSCNTKPAWTILPKGTKITLEVM
jgi:hypothetical protein